MILFFIKLHNGYELQAQVNVGASLVRAEQELIRNNAERGGQVPDRIQGGLGGPGFVSF